MTDNGHIAQEDLALFAMHGCSDEESRAVRAHVDACTVCSAELEQLSSDLAMVAMSVEQHPLPAGARQRFMEKIAAAPVAPLRATQTPVIPIQSARPVRKPMLWVPWTMAAAIALIAVSLLLRVFSLNQEIKNQSHQLAELMSTNARAQAVLDVLTAPKAQHIVLTAGKAAPAPSARAIYLPERGGLILQASNMGPLPEDKAYELWVIPANGKAPIPAGVFRPDATGNASVVLPQLPVGVAAKAFGVTIERAEGSASPTLPIILSGAAPSS